MMSQTVSQWLEYAKQILHEQSQPLLEAQILLAHVLEWDRSKLYAWPDYCVPKEKSEVFCQLIERRAKFEPMAYLVGYKEFFSLSFKVTPDTLVPRMETELLVETVLDKRPSQVQKILDLGTGCGNIACALAHARSNWHITAIDVSEKALGVAQENAAQLGLSNIEFILSDWFSELKPTQFDAIVGNPPYIRDYDLHLRFQDLTFEPRLALTPGKTGFEAYDLILKQATSFLKSNGLLIFEHGFDQGQRMQEKMQEAGFEAVETLRDLAGLDRITFGFKS